MMLGACELLFLVSSLVRPIQRCIFSTATSRIFGADLDFADQFSAVLPRSRGSYPRPIDRGAVSCPGSVTEGGYD